MESLLSVSFDNIARRDANKIRKGLRQIEGLLVQICLASSQNQPERQSSSIIAPVTLSLSRPFESLTDDLAFLEFFRLQQSFEWNVATRLIECLERLLGMGSNEQIDTLIAAALGLVQGVLLLHPPSRSLFGRENHMNLMLDLLDPLNPPSILSSTLLVLVTAMLEQPSNTRLFENLSGLATITCLIKHHTTPQEIKMKVADFLSFYLMKENPDNSPATSFHRRHNSAASVENTTRSNGSDSSEVDAPTRTVGEKKEYLTHHFSNVEQLVKDVRTQNSFGTFVF